MSSHTDEETPGHIDECNHEWWITSGSISSVPYLYCPRCWTARKIPGVAEDKLLREKLRQQIAISAAPGEK